MKEQKIWYAVYTRPRWEKKVAELLTRQGYEAYCPVTAAPRVWGKRKAVVQEPLFRPYVFVRVTRREQWKVLEVSGVINYLTWLGKPAVVRDSEIEAIREFVQRYEQVQLEPVAIRPAMQVLIKEGALSNQVGAVAAVRGNNVEVVIESLGVKLVAIIPSSRLQVVHPDCLPAGY